MSMLILVSSGPIPPCMQKILSSIKAASGRQLNTSVNSFHTLSEYFLLPSITKKHTLIIEPINLIDLRRLVIPPQQKEILRVLDLIAQQQ